MIQIIGGHSWGGAYIKYLGKHKYNDQMLSGNSTEFRFEGNIHHNTCIADTKKPLESVLEIFVWKSNKIFKTFQNTKNFQIFSNISENYIEVNWFSYFV